MKSLIKWMSGVMVAIMLLALPATKAQAQDDYVSYQTFYDELSPYGQWVNDPQYGNVWVPDAGNDFRPYYTNGYWAMTDYGNTWVSNYSWGWAPFHYGRWTYNPFYGWVWIPGNTWGPAWVSWRWGGGNCGWAPMGPGVSIGMSFGYNYPNDWWVFVGPQYMYQRNFHNHWRGPRYNSTYINQTTIINNTYNNTYVYGPRANEIERVTNQRVNSHRIGRGERGRTVVNNNTVNMYRPSVRGNANEAQPRNVVRAPREVGAPQGGVRNTRSEFKTMVARGEVKPVTTGGRNDVRSNNGVRQQPGREQRFDSREGRTNQVRPVENDNRGRMEQRQLQPNRQQMQQPQRQQPQRVERTQMQQPQRQRVEQPQRQQPQRIERQQPQRQQPQRIERTQPQRQQPQRIERPQPQRQQPQRVERPQMQQPQRQQPQRVERPQMQQPQRQQPQRVQQPQRQQVAPRQQQQRPQAAPRPQPQRQSAAPSNSRPAGGDRGGRR